MAKVQETKVRETHEEYLTRRLDEVCSLVGYMRASLRDVRDQIKDERFLAADKIAHDAIEIVSMMFKSGDHVSLATALERRKLL